jgi:hypothetical protein
MRIFLDSSLDDVRYRAIVSKVNHFGALLLKQAPHDVDGRIVTIKERSCSDHPYRGVACAYFCERIVCR